MLRSVLLALAFTISAPLVTAYAPCPEGQSEMSVESVEGIFCVEGSPICIAQISDGACPIIQEGLPYGSYCGLVATGVYGCKTLNATSILTYAPAMTPAPVTEAPSETPVPATETPVPVTETPAPATETMAPSETPAPATETPAPATETMAPSETPVPATEAPAPATETMAPSETPSPSEIPSPSETPAPSMIPTPTGAPTETPALTPTLTTERPGCAVA